MAGDFNDHRAVVPGAQLMMQRGKVQGEVGIDNAAAYGDDGTGYGLRIASWLLHDATRLA